MLKRIRQFIRRKWRRFCYKWKYLESYRTKVVAVAVMVGCFGVLCLPFTIPIVKFAAVLIGVWAYCYALALDMATVSAGPTANYVMLLAYIMDATRQPENAEKVRQYVPDDVYQDLVAP